MGRWCRLAALTVAIATPLAAQEGRLVGDSKIGRQVAAAPSEALAATASCTPTTTALQFDGGYQVSMCYRTPDGEVGQAKAGVWQSGLAGLLWFFNRGNAEVLVKVLNGCSHNGYRWAYVAPVTTLEFNLWVTGPNGSRWTHSNRQGVTASTKSSTTAFRCSDESGGGDDGGGGASAPDLVVQSPSVSDASLSPGQSFTFRAIVRNRGNGRSAGTMLRYYRSSDSTLSTSDTEVGTDAVGGLAASGTSPESVSLNAPSSAGTYYYGACVDSVSGESNTNNNCSSAVRVTVHADGGDTSGRRYNVGDVITTLPSESWSLNGGLSRCSLLLGGVSRVECSRSGYFESRPYKYTCDASTCRIEGRTVTAGSWVETRTSVGSFAVAPSEILAASSSCTPTTTALQFDGGYKVSMCYRTPDGKVGQARSGVWQSGQAGLLWFFDRGNAEVLVKVLNGCSHNGYRWAYVAPVTTLEFNLWVTGPNGRRWTHSNRQGVTASTKSSTTAFRCSDEGGGGDDGDDGGGDGGAPDLVVQSPSVSSASLTAGQSFTFRASVRNRGDDRSAATTLRYYRSSNSTISTSDTQVGTDSVGALSASGSSSESISLTAPSSAGTYYYGACVEPVSGESNTNNNCSSGVRVTVTADDSDDGEEALTVTGDCNGSRNGASIDVTIEGTVRANRSVRDVLLIGYADGTPFTDPETAHRIGSDSLGSIAAGQSRSFSIRGSFVDASATRLYCYVQWTARVESGSAVSSGLATEGSSIVLVVPQ